MKIVLIVILFVGNGIYQFIINGKTLPLNKTADPNNKITSNHNPIITPLNVNWQMDKCLKLGILYREAIKQPLPLVGCKLRDYIPWQYEAIEKDRNCLFRCISKIISGSQEYYTKSVGNYADS